ncbi:hypothetical protein B0O99DRAFT_695296 [Bisporella sp. PMI_857]|nr:hypothetical protein B0O99DRAFT_695296 [Bisporella sp. PMI_857]
MTYFDTTHLSHLVNDPNPETETDIEILQLRYDKQNDTTIVDLQSHIGDGEILSVGEEDQPKSKLVDDSESIEGQTSLQILFLKSRLDQHGCTTGRLRVTPQALDAICTKIHVSTAFLDGVLRPSIWAKQSGASYHRYDFHGNVEAIDTFYHYFYDWEKGPLHVCASYNVKNGNISYFIIDCPPVIKEKIEDRAKNSKDTLLFRPFAIDFLLAKECALWRQVMINKNWLKMYEWHEESPNRMDAPLKPIVDEPSNLKSLHHLSRTWNMFYADLGDLSDRLDVLISACHKLQVLGIPHAVAAAEGFQFLKDRNELRKRWVASFSDRTKLIMNFVFSAANSRNAVTNLSIAGLTKDIAQDTAQDNSSMITIATMTMLFLPGTFVSALFSMVFFNSGTQFDKSWMWLYFAITVPLTGIVFGFYMYWVSKKRARAAAARSPDVSTAQPNARDSPHQQLSLRTFSGMNGHPPPLKGSASAGPPNLDIEMGIMQRLQQEEV